MLASLRIPRGGAESSVRWNVDAEKSVETDREKLRIVLQNLFDNAVSYTNAGGEIRVSVIDDTDIEIANTGSQLSEDDVAHVFDRFWRSDSARSQTGIHVGLGLTLCARLIKSMDGTIAADSTAGGEFQVTVHLPSCADRS